MHASLIRGRDPVDRIAHQGFQRGGLQEFIGRGITGEESAESATSGVFGEINGRHVEVLRSQGQDAGRVFRRALRGITVEL